MRRTSALTAVCRVRSARQKTAGRYTIPLRNTYGSLWREERRNQHTLHPTAQLS